MSGRRTIAPKTPNACLRNPPIGGWQQTSLYVGEGSHDSEKRRTGARVARKATEKSTRASGGGVSGIGCTSHIIRSPRKTAPLFKRVKIACPVGLERRARVVPKCRVGSDKPSRSFTKDRTVKSRFQRVTEVTAVSALAPGGQGGGTVVERCARRGERTVTRARTGRRRTGSRRNKHVVQLV